MSESKAREAAEKLALETAETITNALLDVIKSHTEGNNLHPAIVLLASNRFHAEIIMSVVHPEYDQASALAMREAGRLATIVMDLAQKKGN